MKNLHLNLLNKNTSNSKKNASESHKTHHRGKPARKLSDLDIETNRISHELGRVDQDTLNKPSSCEPRQAILSRAQTKTRLDRVELSCIGDVLLGT